MDEELIWITFRAVGKPGFRRGYGTLAHASREAAHAYAKEHGLVVAFTRDKTAGRPRRTPQTT